MAELARTGASLNAFAGPAFGQLGEVFRPSIAQGSEHLESPLILADCSAAAPSASVVVPSEDFAPFGTSTGHNAHGLKAILSDPVNPAAEPKAKNIA